MTADGNRSSLAPVLDALFAAEREVRRIHAQLAGAATDALTAELSRALPVARAHASEDERALRLTRIASLLGALEGAASVDLLIDVLGADEPEARRTAGEALEERGFDRFKEVALGVERALERLRPGDLALQELPYLLVEIAEPGVMKLLARFLQHRDPEAVACAIEAMVEIGDPAGAALLAPLEKDEREVDLEDEEGEEGKVTLGELATEARELLTPEG